MKRLHYDHANFHLINYFINFLCNVICKYIYYEFLITLKKILKID